MQSALNRMLAWRRNAAVIRLKLYHCICKVPRTAAAIAAANLSSA